MSGTDNVVDYYNTVDYWRHRADALADVVSDDAGRVACIASTLASAEAARAEALLVEAQSKLAKEQNKANAIRERIAQADQARHMTNTAMGVLGPIVTKTLSEWLFNVDGGHKSASVEDADVPPVS